MQTESTKAMAALRQNLVFDAGAPALAEMADQRKQADPYAFDYKLGAEELSFTTHALYTTTCAWEVPPRSQHNPPQSNNCNLGNYENHGPSSFIMHGEIKKQSQ